MEKLKGPIAGGGQYKKYENNPMQRRTGTTLVLLGAGAASPHRSHKLPSVLSGKPANN
jgi:hypothetical protein